MSNSGIKSAVQEFSNEFEEAAKSTVSDLKDQVGQAIETAQQSVTGPTDPAQIQKQQQEAAKREQDKKKQVATIKTFLNQMAQDEQRLRQQRQGEAQKKQLEQQEEHEEKQEAQMLEQEKEASFEQQRIKEQQTKAERKLGVGG